MTALVLRAVIADDESGARDHLRGLLAACRVRTVAECASGDVVADTVRRARPDVVCLDVRMPGTDGVDAAAGIAGCRGVGASPVIVFTTGFADYAARAFDVGAVDYLLKPLAPARVRQAIERVRDRLASGPARGGILAAPHATPPRIFVPTGDHAVAVEPEHISFAEARGRVTMMHTDRGVWTLRAPLGAIARTLAPLGFLRTHRAYVVNVRRVRAFVPWSRDTYSLLLDGGEETHVPVAKSRLAALRESVVWIPGAGGHRGTGTEGQERDRGREQQGLRPRDSRGAGG